MYIKSEKIMHLSCKFLMLWLLSIVSAVSVGCIGDDVSNCGYENNLNLEFQFTPLIEGESNFIEEGADNFSMAVYKSDGSLDRIYDSSYFYGTEDKIEFSAKLEPGKYNFVFLADNESDFYTLNRGDSLEDWHFVFNHSEDFYVPYSHKALYHAFIENFEVKEGEDGRRVVPVEMDRVTNEIKVGVHGLEDKNMAPENVKVQMSVSDLRYRWNAKAEYEEHSLHYEPEYTIKEDGTRMARVYTQDLREDMESELLVTYEDPKTRSGEVLYRADLIKLLMKYLEIYDGEVKDINKVHEFNIDLDLEGKFFTIEVNGWVVVTSEQDIN